MFAFNQTLLVCPKSLGRTSTKISWSKMSWKTIHWIGSAWISFYSWTRGLPWNLPTISFVFIHRYVEHNGTFPWRNCSIKTFDSWKQMLSALTLIIHTFTLAQHNALIGVQKWNLEKAQKMSKSYISTIESITLVWFHACSFSLGIPTIMNNFIY